MAGRPWWIEPPWWLALIVAPLLGLAIWMVVFSALGWLPWRRLRKPHAEDEALMGQDDDQEKSAADEAAERR